MKLYVLFEQPIEEYAGQYAPVALSVIDEYTVDNLGVGLEEAQRQEVIRLYELEELKPDRNFAWIVVNLGTVEQLIRDHILNPTPTIEGAAAVPTAPQGQKHPSYESITVTRGRPGAPRSIPDDEITE